MEERIRKKQFRKNINYKYFIYIVAIIALLQLLTLRACYQEKIFKLPEKLFSSKIDFPISELTLDITYGESESGFVEDGDASVTEEDAALESGENQPGEIEGQNLTDIQKKIVLKALELLDKDIKYGYEVFPDAGYPTSNVWISTDVISVTLKDCGYDLMELIYKDMNEHKEDYPMDIKGRKTPIKYIDFRDVFFQEKFFNRNALTTLPIEYDEGNEDNSLLWQPGDIVYFQFDENNPYADLGGLISPHTNDDGIPLVIMISSELGKVSEVDKLLEYKIVGHYRYPPPDVD
ncbi:MAG: DUF1287 domain-containing protein [Actinobacteria bacterium]|nr:DUF1287 domain-containing protein [Actinomycetota bacterium]